MKAFIVVTTLLTLRVFLSLTRSNPLQRYQDSSSAGWLGGLWGGGGSSSAANDGADADMEEGHTADESEGFLASTYRKAQTAAFGAPEPPPPSWMPQLTRSERIKGFVVLIVVSLIFFFLAFFVGLPMVVLAPTKFALSFTLGSICFMLSFAVLEGPWEHLKRVCTYERLPFTTVYVGSIGLTLYCAVSWRNYLATVVFSVVQITALLWYGATYIPGGTTGMRFLSGIVMSAVSTACQGCVSCVASSVSGGGSGSS